MTTIAPHGGELAELVADDDRADRLREEAVDLPSIDLDHHQLWDLELLLNGAFSPLAGYHDEATYEGVVEEMQLPDGTLWPMPITLDVSEEKVDDIGLEPDARVALRHPEGMVLAVLDVDDVWRPDKEAEAEAVLGTTDDDHPGVSRLLHEAGDVYVGGPVEGVELPTHHTFQHLRYTPAELRHELDKRGWTRVVAFQTRNPMHRVHVELTRRAAADAEANLLIHPVVGRTSPGDIDYFTRVRCYEAVLDRYPEQTTLLSLLPLDMRMAGPREALWHTIIRKNFGCTHFIIGRDHAGAKDRHGEPFYGPYDAQKLVEKHLDELGMELVTFEELVFVEDPGEYVPKSDVPDDANTLRLSGTELRRRLRGGLDIPDWFTYPEVVSELRRLYPPRHRQGFTVFFTGLPSAGKSSVANIVVAKLMEEGSRPVTLLDGDIVRTNLSSELGFSKEDRDTNIMRIAFVAREITKNRGVAVCAPIAPYERTRRRVRDSIEEVGGFVLVHISTPLEVCEQRDRKGMYAKARKGLIEDFTGISDPYEEPEDPELRLDTTDMTPEEAANRVMLFLEKERYLDGGDGGG